MQSEIVKLIDEKIKRDPDCRTAGLLKRDPYFSKVYYGLKRSGDNPELILHFIEGLCIVKDGYQSTALDLFLKEDPLEEAKRELERE